MGTMTWRVRLAPREGEPGEFIGMGRRDTPDDKGRPVTMEVVAIREGRDLRAWLGVGLVKCKGRFKADAPTSGTCVQLNGDPAGPFRAERGLK